MKPTINITCCHRAQMSIVVVMYTVFSVSHTALFLSRIINPAYASSKKNHPVVVITGMPSPRYIIITGIL